MNGNAGSEEWGVPHVADAAAVRTAETALSAVAELINVDPDALSANALLEYTGLLGNIGRVLEGRQIGNAAEINKRSSADAGFEGLAARHGTANSTALFETITGVKNSTAYRYTRVAKSAASRLSDTGLPLPPLFPHTAAALRDGLIGLDAAEALTSALAPVLPRAIPQQLDEAEHTLVGNATGENGGLPIPADALRLQARAFAIALDPDGAEPTAEQQHQLRGLSFRQQGDGMLKITGQLSPEQAAIITPVFDAHMSPRTSPKFLTQEELAAKDAAPELRSKSQERSDVFTTLVEGAGKRPDAPTLHHRAPTVLLTAARDDADNGTGMATSPGTPEPLPMSFVKQMRCDGDTCPVTTGEGGSILDIGRAERLFSPKQRLALIARDGPTCAADDCPIPAWLTEAHHIHAWADGGPTDIANGILLCWFHHRLVERDEWQIETIGGKPKIVPPSWYVNRRYLKPRKPPPRE